MHAPREAFEIGAGVAHPADPLTHLSQVRALRATRRLKMCQAHMQAHVSLQAQSACRSRQPGHDACDDMWASPQSHVKGSGGLADAVEDGRPFEWCFWYACFDHTLGMCRSRHLSHAMMHETCEGLRRPAWQTHADPVRRTCMPMFPCSPKHVSVTPCCRARTMHIHYQTLPTLFLHVRLSHMLVSGPVQGRRRACCW